MIKIGCCAYSYRDLITKGEMNLQDFIEECYRMGLDGTELTGYYFTSTSNLKYLHELKHLCLKRGLSISAASCGAHLLEPEAAKRDENVETAKRWVDVAHELGAPLLRVHGGRWPIEGFAIEKAIELCIETGKRMANYGEEKGVVIALENDGGITRFADDVVKIVRGVNHDWFKLNLDTGNYPDYVYDDIAKSVPYAVHVHAKLETGGRYEIPRRKVDYYKVKSILESAGYNGWVSIEYESLGDPRTEVPKLAKHLFEVFREP